jgi:hypothetical protein
MTSLAAGFVVVTGLGYSKFARAATKRRMRAKNARHHPAEPFFFRWATKLDYEPGQRRIVVEQGRELRWEKFKSSVNVRRLLSSPEFEAHSGSVGIREGLFSAAIPQDHKTYQLGAPISHFFSARQSRLKNGKTLNVDTLVSGNLLIRAFELHNGRKSLKSGIKLYEIDFSTMRITVLTSLSRGVLGAKHPTKFRSIGGAA